jgi:hypothetical protein
MHGLNGSPELTADPAEMTTSKNQIRTVAADRRHPLLPTIQVAVLMTKRRFDF